MDEQKRSEEFLNAATAGLKNDPELRLDVRAELHSHLEEHQREAEANGLDPDAAADEAIRAMGTPADLAADLERANRHRMRIRSLIKIAVQWLLAPLAVAVALYMTDLGTLQ
ncbi:MAG: permease prefix domain 1-containing protein, partial [Victivallales bacterium]